MNKLKNWIRLQTMPSKFSFFHFRFCLYIELILSVSFMRKEMQVSAAPGIHPLWLILQRERKTSPFHLWNKKSQERTLNGPSDMCHLPAHELSIVAKEMRNHDR